jgi:hypothetical protein
MPSAVVMDVPHDTVSEAYLLPVDALDVQNCGSRESWRRARARRWTPSGPSSTLASSASNASSTDDALWASYA